jgi:hypothetical protein
MSECKDCAARRQMLRDALVNAKIQEALGHAVVGVAEAVGLVPKTGAQELKRKLTPKKGKE